MSRLFPAKTTLKWTIVGGFLEPIGRTLEVFLLLNSSPNFWNLMEVIT